MDSLMERVNGLLLRSPLGLGNLRYGRYVLQGKDRMSLVWVEPQGDI
jgi:hypothetical protein